MDNSALSDEEMAFRVQMYKELDKLSVELVRIENTLSKLRRLIVNDNPYIRGAILREL